MNVRVLLFAVAREIAGTAVVEFDAPQPATVADVRDLLTAKCPELGDIVMRSAFAVDGRYAVPSQPVGVGAEVALIPPVSGG
ncbi:MAG: MoaD/ThiS family protein [Thermoguttaceae bacterium]|nr:MoaD/ThiS family protein [Thermoguttaceae bacterium]